MLTASLSDDIEAVKTSVDQYLPEWKELLRVTYLEVAEDFYNFQTTLFNKKAFNLAKLVQNITTAVETRAKSIVQTTKKMIDFMYNKAKTKSEFLALLENSYNFNKAGVMAKTEVNTAANLGMELAAEEHGAETKTWITRRDERVREAHIAIDGQKRPINDPYSNGLQYPGDPAGIASEVINCRCFQIFS